MKTLYTSLFIAVVLNTGCKSIESMVDEGRYDDAIMYALKKLKGEKEPKTKYVVALEDAFSKVVERDEAQIEKLKSGRLAYKYDAIHDVLVSLDRRQSRIMPYLPLVSKDGYAARFAFKNYSTAIANAAQDAAEWRYNEGHKLLASCGKQNAREAHKIWSGISDYIHNYKDVQNLLDEARYLGTLRVGVEVVHNYRGYVPFAAEHVFDHFHPSGLDGFWITYTRFDERDSTLDIHAILDLQEVWVSSGNVREHAYVDQKEITTWEYQKTDCGQYVLDTLGNKIKVEKKELITANVLEVWWEKDARLLGEFLLYDIVSNTQIRSERIESNIAFRDYGCTFKGNRNALSTQTCSKLRTPTFSRLPDDEDLIVQAFEDMRAGFQDKLNQIY